MELTVSTKKNWLQLNIQDSSDEEQEISQNQQQSKLPKVYDLSVEDQMNFTKRDFFGANRVQKGFFVKENDAQQFDSYEVKTKLGVTLQKNIKNEKNQPDQKIQQQNTYDVKTEFIQSPTKSETQKQDQSNFSSNEKKQNEIIKTLNISSQKTKMFNLHLSESSDQQVSDSQQQSKKQNEKHSQIQVKQELGLDKKTFQTNQKNNQQQASEQGQEQVDNNQVRKFQKLVKIDTSPILKEFKFEKQPQFHILDQIQSDQRMRAIVTRIRSGLNLLWPQYEVKLQKNGLSLLKIKKQSFTLNTVYKIYSQTLSGKNRYFGKIESDIAKNSYSIYVSEDSSMEILKAQIIFETESQINNQPRYFEMYLLEGSSTLSSLEFPNPKQKSLSKLYLVPSNSNKIKKFQTRKPIYSQKLRGFVLNFHGRISKASIKNFILQNAQTQQEALMFGRLDGDHFKLQISNPLNCVIGTAISMVQFQNRLME